MNIKNLLIPSAFLVAGYVVATTAKPAQQPAAVVQIDTSKPVRSFIPALALGAGVDGHQHGDIDHIYTPRNVAAMKSAHLTSLSYRLRTELAAEAWHWNPRGSWSEAGHHRGYWTSSAALGPAIQTCYGYRLPRRGSTGDQANNDGYSRLDDGSLSTFWKSNPYLDRHFTGESNALHPQQIVIALTERVAISQLRVWWGEPYALRYTVDYWAGRDEPVDNAIGSWRRFPGGTVGSCHGSYQVVRLSAAPVPARFIRIRMDQSCNRGPAGSTDIRDSLGFAIRELGLGSVDDKGRFHDALEHGKSKDKQTEIFASSSDPWHRATDRDTAVEQPGFDRIFKTGLGHGLPVLMPAGLLYDVPENAAAELRYLRARGYPVQRVELGEEPDGQSCAPEDYGALYIQWAKALHRVDPKVQIGGPSFQTIECDFTEWPLPAGGPSWLARFLTYLKALGRAADFNFCSFEWYPVDDVCGPTMPHLLAASKGLDDALTRLRASGLPPTIPLLMTECGYSAFAARAEVDVEGGLFIADTIGRFLDFGGTTLYLYGYEPGELIQEISCPKPGDNGWGQNALLIADSQRKIQYRTAAYYATSMLTQQWMGATWQAHQLYRASCNQRTVATYAVHRPDGLWSVLLVNRDRHNAAPVRLQLGGLGLKSADIYQYSKAQYQWHPRRDDGYPSPDLPPVHWHQAVADSLLLPPYSVTVVRGKH